MSYQPIENYGMIGDLHTVALVGMNGSIDFMCYPHFDSPTIFAALLDYRNGGAFQIAPQHDGITHRQMYLPDSNILLTRFLSPEGVAELSDFMPVQDSGHVHRLVRRIKTVKGRFRYRLLCDPRFDYGRSRHRAEIKDGGVLFSLDEKNTFFLRSPIPVKIKDGAVIAEFTLEEGQTAAFVFEEYRDAGSSESGHPHYVSTAFKETLNYWRRWISRCKYQGRWREMVHRSALVLKLLTSHSDGSIVAAPTFGLPEEIGGERNWDYRYTWIRDASFTVYALLRLGFTDEAAGFMGWIGDRAGELRADGSLQIMYGIDGRHQLSEENLSHFEGYRGSSPVRIGNGAYGQLQLDIYGELMDSIYLYNKYGEPISFNLWENVVRLVDWVTKNWQQADEGVWEVRGGRQEFLYSRVMCWVAVDRAVRLAMKRSFPAPLDRWLKARDQIYWDVMKNFWNSEQKHFTQTKDLNTIDASSLLMPLVKFISPTDPRWLSTLRAIEKNLIEDSLVYRYCRTNAASDGLSGREGTFNMCSFWYVENLSRAGDPDQARFVFEKVLSYANHLGLYSEELGPCGEHLGNFPQAFTHLGLISAAYNLDQRLNAAGRLRV
ncbi:MAG: glycoside hydrolase family 15 protein [Spirochaetaceae bacterium]|nr:MAG: glycoside hydrolase family 15 protein [Spirochaetaceae bacterium]